MDDKIIVDAAGLQQVSTQLAANSEKIYSLYTNDITSILQSCEEELKVSGLTLDTVYDSFKKLFTSLHSQINNLVDALNNTIIPEYEYSAQTVSKKFNSEFANSMNEYLNIMNRD